jgi:hypothetical protein
VLKVKKLPRFQWLAALAAALIIAAARNANACAMCGLPLGDTMTHAYNSSVIFMISAPYLIALVGSVVAFFAYRSACRRRAEAQDSPPAPQPFANR